jgi:hypothetical protein
MSEIILKCSEFPGGHMAATEPEMSLVKKKSAGSKSETGVFGDRYAFNPDFQIRDNNVVFFNAF